jgi:hypothetical protein
MYNFININFKKWQMPVLVRAGINLSFWVNFVDTSATNIFYMSTKNQGQATTENEQKSEFIAGNKKVVTLLSGDTPIFSLLQAMIDPDNPTPCKSERYVPYDNELLKLTAKVDDAMGIKNIMSSWNNIKNYALLSMPTEENTPERELDIYTMSTIDKIVQMMYEIQGTLLLFDSIKHENIVLSRTRQRLFLLILQTIDLHHSTEPLAIDDWRIIIATNGTPAFDVVLSEPKYHERLTLLTSMLTDIVKEDLILK